MRKIWAGVLDVTRLLLLWHSANRATRALGRFLIGDCLPFPLAGRPFHRFHVGTLSVTNASSTSPTGRFVSAPLPTLSRCSFWGAAILHVGGVSSDPSFFGSESHTPTRQPNQQRTLASNKNFYHYLRQVCLPRSRRLCRRHLLAKRRRTCRL